MKEFHLQIVTPDGLAYEGMIESLLVRSNDGDIEFLANHIDYITTLGIGKARIKENGKDRYASVSGGFLTISSGKATLVAVTCEFAEDIDVERAKIAKQKAKDILASSNDAKTIELAKHKLQKALSRIKVSEYK